MAAHPMARQPHISAISPVYAAIREDGYQAARNGQPPATTYREGGRAHASYRLGYGEAADQMAAEAQAAQNWRKRLAM